MSKKIVVIEDEIFLSDMYKMKLKSDGYDVLVANNGAEGIKLIKKEKPDLILLDLVMPNVDGYQVLDMIEKDKSIKNVKICILSNLGQTEEISQGLKFGVVGYLVKASLTPSQLSINVLKMLNGEILNLKKTTATVSRKKPVKKVLKENVKKENIVSNGKNVLFIEDDEDILDMYSLYLEKKGYQLEIAKNGAWGIKLAKKKKFDIIIMDMVMPAMSGYDMLEKIKEDSENMETAVIILSNSAQDDDIEKALDAGATCFLLKSNITPAMLVKEIENKL